MIIFCEAHWNLAEMIHVTVILRSQKKIPCKGTQLNRTHAKGQITAIQRFYTGNWEARPGRITGWPGDSKYARGLIKDVNTYYKLDIWITRVSIGSI